MMEIGDVKIPIVSFISLSREREIEEIKDPFKQLDVVPVSHETKMTRVNITGFLNSDVHPDDLSIDEQKRKLKRLRSIDFLNNSIDYKDLKGYLLIEDVNFVEDGEIKIAREFEIDSVYFPEVKYE